MREAMRLIGGSRRITVLTGAGVSTASGIPDFRGPDGVWTKDPEAQRLSSLPDYLADPEVRQRAWRSRAVHPAWTAEPNAAHRALVDLERSGRLGALLTQNIDGLHQRAGSDPKLVVELHGSLTETECLNCGDRRPMAEALDRVARGEADPPCRECGGIIKSATISFGQELDHEVLRRAQRAALDCDLFLAAGTSLTVYPAAALPELAVRAGARLLICNAEPTPFDDAADAVVREPLAESLPALVAAETIEPTGRLSTWGDPATW
ncbi:SIR2 family NAD-dependent protein deacylase [Kutzneria sp. CA-103260]|uniref:SIR2 family NAD-dependent protein deacylase n=1 Tax=Kutzneria sp. CA-103260 TaxID=2802641 RepID=UPI001BA50702|nr:Sir2 family NAD-dependent protein deacetylase [Kutzneria sp. CA-103260]QUQ66556.1 SIR2 family transcriptional regulator [Kutzneria sp. CA-103260]